MKLPFLGLRGRMILAFGLGATLITAVFAILTYLLAQNYLVDLRERAVLRQAYTDATLIRDQLETAGVSAADALEKLAPPTSTALVMHWRGNWYASTLEGGQDAVPAGVRGRVASGNAVTQRLRSNGSATRLVVGLPVPSADLELFEIASLEQLDETLQVLGTVLVVGAVMAAIGGAVLGIWASRSVIQPLDRVAATAAQIASGQLDSRLAATRDPGLATIVGSFNSMAETLQQRIERDARFAADVSHELRSPLTTLVTSVDVLNRRRDDLPARSKQALALVTEELERFHRLLRNLLELARGDLGLDPNNLENIPVGELVRDVLLVTGRTENLLVVKADASVRGDRSRLERVVSNLLDNADLHGRGLVEVSVTLDGDRVLVYVDDGGPGIAVEDRQRVFERFATGVARQSSSGTGLGLALAAESVASHSGTIWCTSRPAGRGARFVISLPRSDV